MDTYKAKTLRTVGSIALALAGGALALTAVGEAKEPLPPHTERIEYLAENLPEDGMHMLHYPHFQMSFMMTRDGMMGYGLERIGLKQVAGVVFVDADLTDDGTIDGVALMVGNREEMQVCTLQPGEFDNMQVVINYDYQKGTAGFYQALTGKKKLQTGVFGKDEFNTLAENCEGRWEPRSDVDISDILEEFMDD